MIKYLMFVAISCIIFFLLRLQLFPKNENRNSVLSASANEIFDIKIEKNICVISIKKELINKIEQTNFLSIKNFPVNDKSYLNLELAGNKSITDENTKFLTNTSQGEKKLNAPKVKFFSGTVDGRQNEKAYLIIVDNYIFGAILKNDLFQYCISPNVNTNQSTVINPKEINSSNEFTGCINDNISQFFPSKHFNGIDRTLSNELLEVELAVETDTEFFKATGGNLALAQAYAIAIWTMVSAIYEEQLNIKIYISWLKCWSDNPSDPYNVKGNAYALPDTVRKYWKANYSNVQRDVFHVMTSISYGGGGYGYFDALCDNKEYGFSVSSVQGSHSFPILAFNYDVYIVAHEFGHNFNGQHTHSCYFGVPIDTCITTDAINGGCLDQSITPRPNPGSIMSYCGGINNQSGLGYQVKMIFDPQNAVLMRSTAEKASCLTAPAKPSIVILNPYGNQSFKSGDSIFIKWNSSKVDSLGIEYSTDNGSDWNQVSESISASEKQYVWLAPKICSNNVRLILYSLSDSTVADTSLLPFSIYVENNADMLAFYPFNGNAKNVVCGGFPDGIPVNNPQLVPDRLGNANSAYRFSNGNYIWIPDADLNHKELTIAFWFNSDEWSGKMFFIGTNAGPALNVFEIYHWGALGCSYYLNTGLYQFWTGWPQAQKWNHAVFTFDGKTAKGYINGVLTNTKDTTANLLNFTTTLYIGSRKGSEPYTGAIDDIYIFKKALSESEINSLYNENPLPPDKPDMLYPTNNLMIDTTAIIFSWSKVNNAKYYFLQLSEHNDFDNYPLLFSDSLITDTTLFFSGFEKGKTYYWGVRSVNYFGKSPWNDVFSFIYDSLNDVSDNFIAPGIEILPVPASDKIKIKIINSNPRDFELSLSDEFGRSISSEIIHINSEIVYSEFDVSGLSPGIYFLKLYSDGYVTVKKILIIK